MCGRIGMVTGKGLAGVILEHYSKRVLYVTVSLLVIANTINIGADLGAMASSAQMLVGLPFLFWLIFITVSIIALEVFVPYRTYSRILKYLALTLFSYVLAALVIRLDWGLFFSTRDPTYRVLGGLPAQHCRGPGHDDLPLPVLLAGVSGG